MNDKCIHMVPYDIHCEACSPSDCTTECASQTDLRGEQPSKEHNRDNCDNPWCIDCYGPSPRIAGDGNYAP